MSVAGAESGGDGSVAGVSIVIPAHNEDRLIGACLSSVADGADGLRLEVVVVANGCTDRTVEVARAFDRLDDLRVVEIPTPSKVAALNHGDEIACSFPRIYLDADIRLDTDALQALVRALDRPEPLLAAPRATIDSSGSSRVVRAFFAVFSRLPYANDTISAGVYGLSEAGRRRFGSFPEVTADDLFVQRLFDASERQLVDAHNHVTAPRNLRNLLTVRTRVARGNRELADGAAGSGSTDPARFPRSTTSTSRALIRLAVAHPRMLPAVLVYSFVTVTARALARRHTRGWGRDTSTR